KIDPNEKFIAFTVERSIRQEYHISAKTVESLKDIEQPFESWQSYPIPDRLNELSFLEVFNSKDRKGIADKVIASSSTLREADLTIGRELDMTTDRRYFSSTEKDIPIYRGEELDHFKLRNAKYWCKEPSLIRSYPGASAQRIGVNNILPNSRRKLVAAAIP